MKSVFAVILACLLPVCSVSGGEYRFYHENVLGTSMELLVLADEAKAANSVEQLVLAEIDRLDEILSSYKIDSEISLFTSQPIGKEVVLSNELFEVLQGCDEWTHLSDGAINPAVQSLTELWEAAAKEQGLPSTALLQNAKTEVGKRHWVLNPRNKSAVRLTACALNANALAKGYILDRAVETALGAGSDVRGVMVNIGGDIRVSGDCSIDVAIAKPEQDAVGGQASSRITLRNAAIATSGSSERSFQIAGQKLSHIIDPRSGYPVSRIASASVIAPAATTADAMATICSVLPVPQSLKIVNALAGVECMLVAATGEVFTSSSWPQDGKQKSQATETKSSSTGHEMLVKFEIAKPAGSRSYRRPYVAVWIEDESRFPVRTLALFLMQNNPGPRWYRDVRRWYADDQTRQFVDTRDMIKTVSKPTRNPGDYKVVWDGKDDDGKLLKPGTYTLLIEAAREHGT